LDVVSLEQPVTGQDGQALDLRLRDEHAIERIPVVRGQYPD